jgi:soluble lytic murein transglycosylase-like protein
MNWPIFLGGVPRGHERTGDLSLNRSFALIMGVAAALAMMVPPARAAEPPAAIAVLIADCAVKYGLPEKLLHRVVKRESNYDSKVYHRGHWGLMQIKYETARTMGYRGPAAGLLDPEINLNFGGKYLAGAYLVAGGNADRALQFYSRGYYYEAKRRGLLEKTGLKPKKK